MTCFKSNGFVYVSTIVALFVWSTVGSGVMVQQVTAQQIASVDTHSPMLSPKSATELQTDVNTTSTYDTPWDYLPYQVLIWVASDDPRINAGAVRKDLLQLLSRDFSSIWRVKIDDAPSVVSAMMFRDLDGLDYDSFAAADPVIAVKRDHKEAIRIRTCANVAEFVGAVSGTPSAITKLKARGAASGDDTLAGLSRKLKALESGSVDLTQLWADEQTEALLVSRGLAKTLDEPEAKIIESPIDGLTAQTIEKYDKVFLVRVDSSGINASVDTVELDVLMRYFGSVASLSYRSGASPGQAIGLSVVKAFSPIVRIDNAGQKTAEGLLRAGGLIVNEQSPGKIYDGDVLIPLTRKNDRNGNPFMIGPIDWAYLIASEVEGNLVSMDYYAGRAGGLQGRKNNRTFRTAIKVKAGADQTMLRLHAQGDPDFPLIGYEIYEKELDSKSMEFVGRTDWNGRLWVDKTDGPMRLMYVKNGGAVLARLPMVPGLAPKAIADLRGDDMRLQAEAYIRGVQNSIIDLVAVRELFKARIQMRLERGEMDKAKDLMEALRGQPSNEALAKDMGKKQTYFLKEIGNKNASQRRLVDQMFATTLDLLAKHINPQLINDLDKDLITAAKNGGKLPPKPSEDEDDT